MKSLFLMRHAKSSWDTPNQKDFDRTLNDRGKKDAPEMGERLLKKGVKPDLIVSSPAVRALTTAIQVAKKLDYPEKNIVQEFDIYQAQINDIIHIIRNFNDNDKTIMIFGHNPTFSGLVGYLSNHFIDNLPTAGVVQINFELLTWKQVSKHTGQLVAFDYPKNQSN